MKSILCIALILALILTAAPATALPIVSVDTDPGTPGVQSISNIIEGSPFAIDIFISGMTPDLGGGLNGFEFDLDYDPAVLSAISVTDGGFLLAPVFVVQNSIGTMTVEFAEVSLLPTGAVGDGVLASINFNTTGLGTSILDLNNVVLAAPFGVRIPVAALNDGSVTVAPVPEPATLFLLSAGLFGLFSLRKKIGFPGRIR